MGKAYPTFTINLEKVMSKFVFAIICIVSLMSLRLFATSYGPPKKRDVYSENNSYFVRIDPNTQDHQVFNSQAPETCIWSFNRSVWHDDYFISNNGTMVVWVAWSHCKTDQLSTSAVILYGDEGVIASHTYKDLSHPRRRLPWEIGPIGDFWRIWRGKTYVKDNTLYIDTIGTGKIRIVLSKTTSVEVLNSYSHFVLTDVPPLTFI